MAGAISFNIRGDKELRAKIATMRAAFPALVDRALKEEAQDIVNDAKDNYAPIETEALKNSIRYTNVQRGTGRQVEIVAGGTPETAPYAIAVHEHFSEASPPSWHPEGKPIHWSKAGTGPKYLEKPLQKAQAGMVARIADRLWKFIASGATP